MGLQPALSLCLVREKRRPAWSPRPPCREPSGHLVTAARALLLPVCAGICPVGMNSCFSALCSSTRCLDFLCHPFRL